MNCLCFYLDKVRGGVMLVFIYGNTQSAFPTKTLNVRRNWVGMKYSWPCTCVKAYQQESKNMSINGPFSKGFFFRLAGYSNKQKTWLIIYYLFIYVFMQSSAYRNKMRYIYIGKRNTVFVWQSWIYTSNRNQVGIMYHHVYIQFICDDSEKN